ncbi:hypothetical protein MUP01_00290 [Candidatus Bathyarchaeota archaeon]|jgi:hypothetical protein|nr:hypothetical protein [Candidatus Bathyarchaeota archaeon]
MSEILDIQNLVSEFLSLAAIGAYDHAKEQVTYARIINNYRQLTPFPFCER